MFELLSELLQDREFKPVQDSIKKFLGPKPVRSSLQSMLDTGPSERETAPVKQPDYEPIADGRGVTGYRIPITDPLPWEHETFKPDPMPQLSVTRRQPRSSVILPPDYFGTRAGHIAENKSHIIPGPNESDINFS